MEKKRKIELETLNALKEKKMSEVFGDKGKKEKKEPRTIPQSNYPKFCHHAEDGS